LFGVRVWSQTIKSADASSSTGLSIVHLRSLLLNNPRAHICHDLINVGSSLREYVRSTHLKDSQHKRSGISREPPLGNCCLKRTSHTRQDKVLISTNVICGILFPSHAHCWVGNSFPPTAISHTNEPALVIYGVVMVAVRLVNLRVLWC